MQECRHFTRPTNVVVCKDAPRLAPSFDADRLSAELRQLETRTWGAIHISGAFDGEWTPIPLYAREGAASGDLLKGGPGKYGATPVLRDLAYIASVVDSIPGEKLRVRLMRLGPDSVVKQHRDRSGGGAHGSIS